MSSSHFTHKHRCRWVWAGWTRLPPQPALYQHTGGFHLSLPGWLPQGWHRVHWWDHPNLSFNLCSYGFNMAPQKKCYYTHLLIAARMSVIACNLFLSQTLMSVGTDTANIAVSTSPAPSLVSVNLVSSWQETTALALVSKPIKWWTKH